MLLLSPLGEGHGPSFEQTWIPLTQGCFVPNLAEIGSVVLKKKILKYFQYNFSMLLLPPLEEGCQPSYVQTWFPLTQGCFVPSLVEIGLLVQEKK